MVAPQRHFVEVEVAVEVVKTHCKSQEEEEAEEEQPSSPEWEVEEVGQRHCLEEVVEEVEQPCYLGEEEEEVEGLLKSLRYFGRVEVVEVEPKNLHTQNQVEEEREEEVGVEHLPSHHLGEVEEAAWTGRERQVETGNRQT